MDPLSSGMKNLRNRGMLIVIALLCLAYISDSTHLSDLEKVIKRGHLVVLTLPGATTYFEDGDGKNGFEYVLAKAFADSLGVGLKVTTKSTLPSLLLSVGGPQGEFAAANLVNTADRGKSFKFSYPYHQVVQQLIYRAGDQKPKTLSQLKGELSVIAGSSHSENLKQLRKQFPSLKWIEENDAEMSELIRKVHDGEISYTVTDSLAYEINRHIYPNTRKAFNVSAPQALAWVFPKNGDGTLLNAANNFLQQYTESGQLDDIKQQLFAQTKRFSAADSKQLGRLVNNRLPKYEAMFRQTAQKYNLDWHFVAAIAYQESHWNPRAKSPTGVRGLMMLTLDTAKEMGVTNRLDAAQSLEGGVAYFSKLKARLPERIKDPDRSLFALAAYNVGFGHLEDARILTVRNNRNPDLWADVREHLPLLSKKKYYSTLKRGYARGNEPVIYVDNIQYYRSYLQLNSVSQQSNQKSTQEKERENWQPVTPHAL
ncbi:membrane-bound lytic murein transglycosylase MltF [Porticoccaceae bacterium]|jgi:membrane-bound lytic murein transglycosylase F|nr:membrane-bound lytic murein transglycosylase MltF [Porticoccaceae bacterium]